MVYKDSLAKSEVPEKPPANNKVSVEVVSVRTQPVQERITLVGSLYAIAETSISARVNGYIRSIPLDVGDRVSAGNELVLLEDADQQEAVSQAEAALNVAKAQLRAQIADQQLAERNVIRQKRLAEDGAGTEQQLDAAEGALRIANARVDLENARVAEAEATLLQAQLALKELRLTSPIDGYVAERFANVGDLAKPDVPILRVVNLDVVQTTVHVVEKDYRKVHIGQKAEVTVDAYPQRAFYGEVKRIAPVLAPDTRTAAVHIVVNNPEQLLKPGMYARVSLRSEQSKSGTVVPVAAVAQDALGSYVYVVSGDPPIAEKRTVETGTVNGQSIEILDGLESTDSVITLGSRMVKPGQPVMPLAVDWPQALTLDETRPTGGIEPSTAE